MSVSVMAESSSEAAASLIPDRADQPVSVTTERFLRAIAGSVPLERIEELHLFSPLRQGSMETGIAVVAARVIPPPPEAAPEPTLGLDAVDEQVVDGVDNAAVDEQAAGDEVVDGEAVGEEAVDEQVVDERSVDVKSEAADAEATAPEAVESRRDPSIERHTVYTARYRLIVKGPERGKWEADVVEEADAPLVTVETVVRGVQRRAGEDSEIVRYSAPQLARILRMELGAPETEPTP
jgi:hypothetical protein